MPEIIWKQGAENDLLQIFAELEERGEGAGARFVSKIDFTLEPISKIGNGCVAGDLALRQGARRENILHGSLTNEQRRCSGKDSQPCGLSSGGLLAALLLSYRTLRLCSFVAPCQPPARA
jgi:hypothetical protein